MTNETCDNTCLTVNGNPAEVPYSAKAGDKIEVQFDSRILCVEVLQVDVTVCKDDAVGMYKEI